MLFRSRRFIENSAVPTTEIQNHELKIVDHYKYLGVTLDQKLDFKLHTQNIYKIAAHKIYILKRIRPYINTDTALRIYKSKILPFLDYGDILYDCTFAYLLEKLQKLQFRAARVCLQAGNRTSRVELTRSSRLPELKNRRLMHLRNCMFKRKAEPQYVDLTERRTREGAALLFKVPRAHCAAYEKSVESRGAREWNSLSVDVRQVLDKRVFKNI